MLCWILAIRTAARGLDLDAESIASGEDQVVVTEVESFYPADKFIDPLAIKAPKEFKISDNDKILLKPVDLEVSAETLETVKVENFLLHLEKDNIVFTFKLENVSVNKNVNDFYIPFNINSVLEKCKEAVTTDKDRDVLATLMDLDEIYLKFSFDIVCSGNDISLEFRSTPYTIINNRADETRTMIEFTDSDRFDEVTTKLLENEWLKMRGSEPVVSPVKKLIDLFKSANKEELDEITNILHSKQIFNTENSSMDETNQNLNNEEAILKTTKVSAKKKASTGFLKSDGLYLTLCWGLIILSLGSLIALIVIQWNKPETSSV